MTRWTITDIIPETLRAFGRNWVTLVVGNLVAMSIACAPILLSTAVAIPILLATRAPADGDTHQIALGGGTAVVMLLAFAGSFVLFIMFAPALSRIALAAARGQHPRIRDVFDFRRAGTFFGAGLLSGLAVIAGTLLLIVPGIIVALALAFVSFYVVDKPTLRATDALDASWTATRGHRLRLFGLVLIGGIANITLSALFATTVWLAPLKLALSLVVGPISTLALAEIYLRLDPPPEPPRILAA